MKVLFIVLDGLSERPLKELGNQTPLEKAFTPNLDFLAREGLCGVMEPFYSAALPTSEEGHFSLFGYNSKTLGIKRGIFTAMGSGIKLKQGDVALRGNFAFVNKNWKVIDRRAGRIKETSSLIKSLNGIIIKGVKFLIKPAGEHRVAVVMRGKNLSPNISDGDPHYSNLGNKIEKIVSLDKKANSIFTAEVLNEFLEKAHFLLDVHPFNEKRKKKGLSVANFILTRGASSPKKIVSFEKRYGLKACCIAGKLLYKQIAKSLGMSLITVKGANGLPNTNLKGKFLAVRRSLNNYDFVFLHIKATDSLAEDGDFIGKKKFIEKIDSNMKNLLKIKDCLIVVTADHSTCCSLKSHCKELIPFLIYGDGKNNIKAFSERDCKQGSLGKIKQLDLMKKIVKLKR